MPQPTLIMYIRLLRIVDVQMMVRIEKICSPKIEMLTQSSWLSHGHVKNSKATCINHRNFVIGMTVSHFCMLCELLFLMQRQNTHHAMARQK